MRREYNCLRPGGGVLALWDAVREIDLRGFNIVEVDDKEDRTQLNPDPETQERPGYLR